MAPGPVLDREDNAAERSSLEPEQLFSPFDRALGALRERFFERHRSASVAVSTIAYAIAVLALGSRLGVSTNYFVVLPVICAAIGYGLPGGIIAGALGLPVNLALYAALRHPEYSPASQPIAEVSGIIIGTVLGYLSDYHGKLNAERALRKQIENDLRHALSDRETLFREVHHRVKNNLNLIKSIIGLQARRSDDPAFKDAAAALMGRILSISFVHERLYRTAELSAVAIDEYIENLVGAIKMTASGSETPPTVSLALAPRLVSMDIAVPIGLITNELVTNAIKHGRPGDGPLHVSVELAAGDGGMILTVRDDGSGFQGLEAGQSIDIEEAAVLNTGKLGLTLLDLMASQLGGEGAYRRDSGWTEFRLSFPYA
ncbi:MAG: hypothetical protein CVV47_06285 [Spirochaetae bacterium HGW-Spirochaetae-3]|nr:MAG: hypothetical protein CVV47_06285 [Spirochaetae bacterium HGW-Spirochaetae-3]